MPNPIEVKSVLNKLKKRDSWFICDYTVNMYSGCSFNCLYCYIRGSKYGTHMERNLGVKVNAIERLEKQLATKAKKEQYGFIVVSSATDPYLQFESEYQLTRQALELILKYRFPVHILTKSDLVLRDLDILEAIDKTAILPPDLQKRLGRGTLITFSFSTIDEKIAKIFEPGATLPAARLAALKEVKARGFITGISMMPMIPWISDRGEHLHQLFDTFSKARADYLLPATITLFGDQPSDSKTLIFRAVKKHYPELVGRYEKLFQDNTELPKYYRDAFHRKMKELAETYQIRDRILAR